MKTVNQSHTELINARAAGEVAMLANLPDDTVENPDFTELAKIALDAFITAAQLPSN